MIRARATLHKLGGCVGIPSWGKFWLAVLNVHDWKGVNPTPSELWLLPDILPFHPGRWWPHSRQVAIPQAYLSGVRFQAELDPLLRSLREVSGLSPRASSIALQYDPTNTYILSPGTVHPILLVD